MPQKKAAHSPQSRRSRIPLPGRSRSTVRHIVSSERILQATAIRALGRRVSDLQGICLIKCLALMPRKYGRPSEPGHRTLVARGLRRPVPPYLSEVHNNTPIFDLRSRKLDRRSPSAPLCLRCLSSSFSSRGYANSVAICVLTSVF